MMEPVLINGIPHKLNDRNMVMYQPIPGGEYYRSNKSRAEFEKFSKSGLVSTAGIKEIRKQ